MIFKIIDEKIIVYLVSSVVPLLAISIFFADLICSILSLFFLVYLAKKNSHIFYKNIFFLISIIFYLTSLISSFLSQDIFFSLKSSLPFFRIITFIFLISYLIQNNKYFLEVFYNFIKYTFLILIIYGLIQYSIEYYDILINNNSSSSYVRLKLPFSDEEKLGSFLVRLYGLILAIYILNEKFNKSENIFFIFLTLFTSILVLLSGERSSLFFLILFLFVSFVLLNFSLKLKLAYFSTILLIFTIILSLNSSLSNRILFDKNNKINFKSNNDEIVIFTAQHTAHYLSGFRMFLNKPLIGQGPRMFRLLCDDKDFEVVVQTRHSCSSHVHNTYLQLLAETGIIGFLLFSMGFFHITYIFIKQLIFKLIFKKKSLSNYQIVISASALLVFWPFSPNGNFFNNWMLIINAFAISFYVSKFFKYYNYKKK